MKTSRILLLLLTCLVISSCAQKEETTFVSKNFPLVGITISLPQEWGYVDGSVNMKNKLFKCFYKDESVNKQWNTVAVSLSYEIVKAPPSSDIMFDQIKKTIQSQASNKEVVESEIDKIQDKPTRSYKYNFSYNGVQFTTYVTYFIEQNILYCFNSTILADQFDKYIETIKKISSSIQIGKFDASKLSNGYEYKKFESRYKNDKYGFEIDFPIGWYYLEEIMGNAVQVKKADQDTSEIVSIGISVQEDYKQDMTSLEYSRAVIKSLKKQKLVEENENNIVSEKITHPSVVAYKAHFFSFVNNKKQIVFIYTTIKGGKGYLLTATTDLNHKSVNENLFDDIFKTMTIK